MTIGAANGDLGRHTKIGHLRGEPLPILTPRTHIFQKVVYATSLTTVLTFGFTKLAVLLFYQRIFQGRWIQTAVWFMVGIDFIWTVGFFFSNLLQCYPIKVNWTGIGNINGYCVNTNTLLIAQSWSDITTDIVILALPLPCIWALQMSVRRKLAVCGIFLLGALTVGAGIAKIAIFYRVLNQAQAGPDDPALLAALDISYGQTPLVYWPFIESSVGIIGACLPLLRPLFAGAASRGFMRDLQSVDIPTSERSETLWNKSDNSRATEEWNSTISTVRWGSDSMPGGEHQFREKRLPSLPASSLNMLNSAPNEGPWMKKVVVRGEYV
ncbi:MAG: hypothetical protein Q9170_002406 [Blastenia crenularia]